MERYDSQMAARVWQRVQGSGAAEDPLAGLLVCLQEELTDIQRYSQLSNTLGSTAKPTLQQLIKATQQCVAILYGIHRLLTDTVPEVKPFPLPKELPVSSLRRCYGTTLNRVARYEHWCSHPEYSPGFLKLTDLSRECCQLLLQLLGILRTA